MRTQAKNNSPQKKQNSGQQDQWLPGLGEPSDRQALFILVAILLLAGVLLGLMLNPFLTVVNHDSAIFCILAQSLLKGHYLLVSEPAPQPYFTFPPLLPVLLAGLMRLLANNNPETLQIYFKSAIDLLFLLSIPVYFMLLKNTLKHRKLALILTGLLAVNPIIFKYSSDVLSDTPYWALSMLAIYALWQCNQAFTQEKAQTQNQAENQAENKIALTSQTLSSGEIPANRKKSTLQYCKQYCLQSWLWMTVVVGLTIACALLRQIGLAMVVTTLVFLIFQRQWVKLLVSGLVIVLTVGGWQNYEHTYRSTHRSGISSLNQQGVQAVLDKSPIKLEYVKHFLIDRPVDLDQNRSQANVSVLLGNMAQRVVAYTNFCLDQLLPRLQLKPGNKKINITHFVGFQVLFWVLMGLGVSWVWRRFYILPFYVGLYMAVLSVYPYISFRFLLPVYPFIQCFVLVGLMVVLNSCVKEATLKRILPGALAGFVLLALIGQLPNTIHHVNEGLKLKLANQGPSLRKGNSAYYRSLLWMKANLPKNSLIIARKPPVVYYYARQKSTAFPFTADKEKLFAYIVEKQKRFAAQFDGIYIFEDTVFGSSRRYLTPVVVDYSKHLRLVYTEPQTQSRLWQLLPSAMQAI